MFLNADWSVIDGMHIGTTWQIRLNGLCTVAMQPYVNLLWPLVLNKNIFIHLFNVQIVTKSFFIEDIAIIYCILT